MTCKCGGQINVFQASLEGSCEACASFPVKMKLILEAWGNPDFGESPSRWLAAEAEVATLEHASRVVQETIRQFALGGGNWLGQAGNVYAEGKLVAHVSYNGRVWSPATENWQKQVLLREASSTGDAPIFGFRARVRGRRKQRGSIVP